MQIRCLAPVALAGALLLTPPLAACGGSTEAAPAPTTSASQPVHKTKHLGKETHAGRKAEAALGIYAQGINFDGLERREPGVSRRRRPPG